MKKYKLILLGVFISVSSFISYSYVDNYFEISKNLDIFATLFKELNVYYVDETKPGELMKKGIDGMLENLDPYTNYIPESEIEDHRFQMTGQYGGIGALIRQKDDFVIIAEPYENFPAHKAGLIAGDVILEIDGRSAKGKSTSEISRILKGEPGTNVKLRIQRPGQNESLEKMLIREEIKINSVPYYGMLDNGVGYVNLTSFTREASQEVKDAINELKKENDLKGLVLDLRGNPGGLLIEAVNISNLFIDKGEVVVSTRGKVKEWEKTYHALNQPLDTTLPLAVLVNRGSASASEIVSGTIQDLDRGVVIGTRTFGKGLVQTTRPLSYDAQLKITTAKYYIPSGRCIQALDYSHRREDGSVGKVPDSLKTAFKTRNGRKVFDGGGIEPDIYVKPHKYSNIAGSLVSKSLIFEYATKYVLEHPEIPAPRKFEFTDQDYNDFVTFLADKEYDYTTRSEQLLEDLQKAAEKEKYYSSLEDDFEDLQTKIKHNKKEDLKTFKDELVELIEEEIVSRYYYQKGRIENSLSHDPEVKEALNVLADKDKYRGILDGTYETDSGNTEDETEDEEE